MVMRLDVGGVLEYPPGVSEYLDELPDDSPWIPQGAP